ncbi:hypothetical protein [Rhizobium sp. NXC24]|uniref:hypothetical protein n=1 Tax=Rhizobium sp. NXC24 TaxID=2048897 RepID=UPI000CDF381A|nr:hypothetical protein [Rhizobium sp. NXC24]AVA22480.1 hypothetical protein NXC24_CH02850 [Rhizobium sp. NXC24]
MSDKSVVHIGENSPEEVAFKLFKMIAEVEKKATYASMGDLSTGWAPADKDYILKTYGECITTVRDGWYQAK